MDGVAPDRGAFQCPYGLFGDSDDLHNQEAGSVHYVLGFNALTGFLVILTEGRDQS